MWSFQNDILEPYQVILQSIRPLKLSRWQLAKFFVKHALRDVSISIVLLCVVLGVLVALFLASRNEKVALPRELPIVKGDSYHFEDIIVEGRKKYPETPYLAVNRRHEFVICPQQTFDELKRLPESKASAKDFFRKMNAGEWTYIGQESSPLLKTLMADLTRAIPARVHKRQEDTRMAFDSIIGYCPEPRKIGLLMSTFEIVTKINACAFVGRELGTNDKWVKAVMRSPLVIHVANLLMQSCWPIFRPLLAPLAFLPTKLNQRDMRKLLTPVLKEDMRIYREATDRAELLRPKPEAKIPLTAMLLARYKDDAVDVEQLVKDYILISFDSTPSTATALYHAICELAAHPETADVLRAELDEVMVDGQLPRTHLQELKLMDSFLRESFRLHPVSLFSLQRVLTAPVQLSAGPALPPGAVIGVDAAAINRSPTLWENPHTFDMYRFYKKRQQPGNENAYHLLSTGSDSPGWGDGTQACPGRFFATSTLKIAFAHILRNYDITMSSEDCPPKMTPLANGTWAPDDKVSANFTSRK